MTGSGLKVFLHAPRSRWDRLDLIGVGLFAALVAWIVLASQVTGGNPWPMAALVAGVGATTFAARDFARVHGAAVPGALVVVLVIVVAVAWPQATHRHFGLLGYSNANGALYAVGVGAAGLVMLRSTRPGSRVAAGVAALFLAALPWLFNADAASGSAIVLLGVTAWLLITGRPSRWLVAGAALVAIIALIATIVTGLLYTGGGESDAGWRLTERRLVLWNEATDMVADSPIVGRGPGRFAEFSPTAQRDRDASWAHHEPLTVGAEVGLPAMALLLLIVAWAFVWLQRGSGRRGATLASVVLAVAFTHATIDFVWHNPGVPLALAVVVGAGATSGRSEEG